MDGISLSWALRIQELEIILRCRQEELQVQGERLGKAKTLLGQASDQQRKLKQQALEVRLQKAQLQCAVFELETEVHTDVPNTSEETQDTICCQQRLDHTLQQKLRVAATMKREQKEMQEFASLMKSMVHDNSQHTTRLQDNIVQENKQTEHMRCELALVQEALVHTQREQHNLQGHLARQEQSLLQNQTEVAEIETQLVQLKCDKQQEEQHAQEQLNDSKQLLTQLLAEQRHSELRFRQEQAAGKSMMSKHQVLQSQMQKVKQAVLAMSE